MDQQRGAKRDSSEVAGDVLKQEVGKKAKIGRCDIAQGEEHTTEIIRTPEDANRSSAFGPTYVEKNTLQEHAWSTQDIHPDIVGHRSGSTSCTNPRQRDDVVDVDASSSALNEHFNAISTADFSPTNLQGHSAAVAPASTIQNTTPKADVRLRQKNRAAMPTLGKEESEQEGKRSANDCKTASGHEGKVLRAKLRTKEMSGWMRQIGNAVVLVLTLSILVSMTGLPVIIFISSSDQHAEWFFSTVSEHEHQSGAALHGSRLLISPVSETAHDRVFALHYSLRCRACP